MNNLYTLNQLKNSAVETWFINSSNSDVDYANGKLTYKLVTPRQFTNTDIALKTVTMYNSYNTIDSKYNNTSFSIVHNGNVETVDITPGMYDIGALNAFLQFKMDSLGWYVDLLNKTTLTTTRIYYLKFEPNITYNRVTLTASVVPLELPDETDYFLYTKGSGLSLSGKTMQLKIVDNNFQQTIGFNSGSYPSTEQGTVATINGQNLPHPSPIEQIFVTCNQVFETNTNFLPNAIANFDLNASIRAQVMIQKEQPTFFGIKDGRYDSIVIQLLDQNRIPISYDQDEVILLELQTQSRYSN